MYSCVKYKRTFTFVTRVRLAYAWFTIHSRDFLYIVLSQIVFDFIFKILWKFHSTLGISHLISDWWASLGIFRSCVIMTQPVKASQCRGPYRENNFSKSLVSSTPPLPLLFYQLWESHGALFPNSMASPGKSADHFRSWVIPTWPETCTQIGFCGNGPLMIHFTTFAHCLRFPTYVCTHGVFTFQVRFSHTCTRAIEMCRRDWIMQSEWHFRCVPLRRKIQRFRWHIQTKYFVAKHRKSPLGKFQCFKCWKAAADYRKELNRSRRFWKLPVDEVVLYWRYYTLRKIIVNKTVRFDIYYYVLNISIFLEGNKLYVAAFDTGFILRIDFFLSKACYLLS